MSTTESPARALQGAGTIIELANGDEVELRYSMASLVAIEESFGNLARLTGVVMDAAGALEASQAVAAGKATDEQRELDATYQGHSLFRVLCDALAPGLLDVQVADPRTGEPIWLGENIGAVQRLLDPGRLREYLSAFSSTFARAFAQLDTDGGEAGDPPAQATAKSPSRGKPGGTSQSAKRATARTRSGA